MKRFILSLVTLILLVSANGQNKKAIFVIVDGIPADVIEKLNTPNLDAIAKVGGFTHAAVGGERDNYSQTPTISAVGYNTILTGVWVNKHNVWDNDIAAPNYNYPTIFRLFKTQYPDKKTAIFSSWQDNRTKLVGDKFPATGNLAIDHSFDGLELDTIKYPHDKEAAYMHQIDEAVVDHAASFIKTDAPDLSWVYLEYTDDMGHRYGDSPQFYKSIEMMDVQMGKLWEAIQYRQQTFGEQWQIIITTDHGRGKETGKNHGGQSDRERAGWIVTNAKNLNSHFKDGTATIADIMPTIARFLDVKIDATTSYEVDGVPLTGRISSTYPTAILIDGKIEITWKPQSTSQKGTAKIFVATSNNIKTGGADSYLNVATVPLAKGRAKFNAPKSSDAFYKIVIQFPDNTLNRWIVPATLKK